MLGDACAFLRRLSELVGSSASSNASSKRKEWRAFLESNEAKREREIDDMAGGKGMRPHMRWKMQR